MYLCAAAVIQNIYFTPIGSLIAYLRQNLFWSQSERYKHIVCWTNPRRNKKILKTNKALEQKVFTAVKVLEYDNMYVGREMLDKEFSDVGLLTFITEDSKSRVSLTIQNSSVILVWVTDISEKYSVSLLNSFQKLRNLSLIKILMIQLFD